METAIMSDIGAVNILGDFDVDKCRLLDLFCKWDGCCMGYAYELGVTTTKLYLTGDVDEFEGSGLKAPD